MNEAFVCDKDGDVVSWFLELDLLVQRPVKSCKWWLLGMGGLRGLRYGGFLENRSSKQLHSRHHTSLALQQYTCQVLSRSFIADIHTYIHTYIYSSHYSYTFPLSYPSIFRWGCWMTFRRKCQRSGFATRRSMWSDVLFCWFRLMVCAMYHMLLLSPSF